VNEPHETRRAGKLTAPRPSAAAAQPGELFGEQAVAVGVGQAGDPVGGGGEQDPLADELGLTRLHDTVVVSSQSPAARWAANAYIPG